MSINIIYHCAALDWEIPDCPGETFIRKAIRELVSIKFKLKTILKKYRKFVDKTRNA